MKKGLIIAIDGPAASGKSTVAQRVAKELGYTYVDTGAMYRALTLKALKKKIDLNDDKALVEVARNTKISLKNNKDCSLKIFLDGKDVTKQIRKPEVTNKVGYIANIAPLRSIMVKKQRDFGKRGSIVIEGRDVTSVVFPDADRKFYLDASFNERLKRRHKQLILDHKEEIPIRKLKGDIETRDKKDKRRRIGALKRVKDAIYIDTTNLTIPQVVKEILFKSK